MIAEYEISPKAAKAWVRMHPMMPRQDLRSKWDEYTTKAEKVEPFDTIEGHEYWKYAGYAFLTQGEEIVSVFPFRPHLYRCTTDTTA